MKTVILISGKKRVGKDTLTNYLISKFKDKGKDVTFFSFASPIRESIGNLMNEYGMSINNDEDKEKFRPMMQLLGRIMITKDKLYWVKRAFEKYSSKDTGIYICNDLRFKHELMYFKELAKEKKINLITIRVNYPKNYKGLELTDVDASEIDLDDVAFNKKYFDYSYNRELIRDGYERHNLIQSLFPTLHKLMEKETILP